MTVRWGIVATGRIARTFADATMLCGRSQLTAVASRSAEGAAEFAGHYPNAGLRTHATYAALLGDPEVDAVYIACPHTCHAEWAIRALRAGKHVLCEKPMGISHAEVMAMVDTARVERRFLMEAFMYRCHPQTRAIVDIIESGQIGEVRHIEASFGFHAPFKPASRLFDNTLAGGGIMDVGCYPVSMARLLMGEEPLTVTAHGRLGTTGVDEWAAALLGFSNGACAQLATAVSANLSNQLIVSGSTGQLRVTNPWNCADANGDWQFELSEAGLPAGTVQGHAEPLYVLEVEHVADMLEADALESSFMGWDDSLGNALSLDRWRRGIGLEFVRERPATHPGPILGALTPTATPLPTGTIKHLSKPVSRLVMGCDNQPSMSHAAVMWDDFVESGGNCFDTAHIYGGGSMESLLGFWQVRRSLRESLVIIGKGAHTPHNYPEHVESQLTESLDRLQTDYVDVYFLHRDNLDVPVGEFVDALNREAYRGRIRVFGGSNWTLERVRAANDYAAANNQQAFSVVSNNFSLAHMISPLWPGVETATDPGFRDYLESSGLALMPWSSQARGFFTPWAGAAIANRAGEQATITNVQPSVAELRRTWFSADNFERRERAGQLAAERGVQMIEVALAYVAQQPFECFPLIGPRALAETRSCIAALNVTLSPTELRWLESGD